MKTLLIIIALITSHCMYSQTTSDAISEAKEIATKRIRRIELASLYASDSTIASSTRESLYHSFQQAFPECQKEVPTLEQFQEIKNGGQAFEQIKLCIIESTLAEVKKSKMEEMMRKLLEAVSKSQK